MLFRHSSIIPQLIFKRLHGTISNDSMFSTVAQSVRLSFKVHIAKEKAQNMTPLDKQELNEMT
jgi:hypothetical protein